MSSVILKNKKVKIKSLIYKFLSKFGYRLSRVPKDASTTFREELERFEDFGVELQKSMRRGFIDLSKEFSNRIEVVNGHQSVDELANDIFSVVKAKLL